MPLQDGVYVGRAWCADLVPSSGEGLGTDHALANERMRAVVRHPLGALTAHGVGGGTLVDLAPWGTSDPLHEAIPVVGGGWLDVDVFEVEADRIRVGGVVTPFVGQDAPGAGERREIAWVAAPDDPVLRLDGADGLWIHPAGDATLLDGWLWRGDVVLGHDGEVVRDDGGAVWVRGVTSVFAAPPEDALRLASDERQALSGTAPGAERLDLFRDGERVGYLPVVDGAFDADVPAHVDAVQAVATGRVPSPTEPPGDGLALALGPAGEVDVASDVPMTVRWTAGAREGEVALPVGGGVVPTGAGPLSLSVDAGPAFEPAFFDLTVPDDGRIVLDIAPAPAFPTGDRVLAALPWYGDRSTDHRVSDATALRRAAASGIGFAVVAPDDDTAGVSEEDPPIRFRNGATLRSPDGWSVVSWPWGSAPRRPGHGAVAPWLSPLDGLGMAWGGVSTDRFTAVDLAWLEAIDTPPWDVEFPPDFAIVDGPDPAPWFRWLDAGDDLLPLGPLNWVTVGDPDAFAAVDVEDGLVRGRGVATTGPLLLLRTGLATPGDTVSLPSEPTLIPVEITAREGLDHVVLYGSGGRTLGTWSGSPHVQTRVAPGSWLVAAGWSDDGDWAVTAPIWFRSR